jgi:hypothetical protein
MSPLVTTIANSGARGRAPAPPAGNTPTGLIYSHDFEDGLFPTQGPVIPSGLGGECTVSTVNPVDGLRSFQVRYPGTPPGTAQWQEYNIALPKCYGGFGMDFDTRFSSNFVLRPDGGGGNNTSKWFQFWQQTDANAALNPRVRTDYGQIMSVGASIRRKGVGNQIEMLVVVTDNGCLVCNNNSFVLIDPDTPANGPIKPGQKHNIKWRIKYSSGINQNNGVYELLVDNVVVFQNSALGLWPYAGRASDCFVSWGYLMGYSNGGFTNDTIVQWDNFKMYNTSSRWW